MPARIAVAAVVLAGAALWFCVLGPPPAPGFIRDEASVAYNAYTLSHNLHDQNGGFLPLYIKSFGDYKSPLFPYVLAVVFRATGPSKHVALDTASVLVFAAILLIGWLAWRRTRSLFVVCSVVVLGVLTPWLYELGRTSYETIIEPLTLMLVVLAVDWAYRSDRRARAIPVGVALGALTYSYAAGRILAPLLVVAIFLVFFRSDRRWVLETCVVYAATLVPVGVYSLVHGGALSARFDSTTYLRHGMSPGTIVYDFFRNYVTDANLEHWVVSGDPTPYIHVHGAAQLYGAIVVLAAIGVATLWRTQRGDRFWWFVLVALVLSPITGAVTDQRHYSLRLLAIPMLLLVLAIPALELVPRSRGLQLTAAILAIAVGAQFWQWRDNYDFNNKGRTVLFEGHLPPLLQRAFAGGRTVYVSSDDVYAQTHALWYAVTHDIPKSHVAIGGAPPRGSIEFGRFSSCTGHCTELAEADTYWIAKAI
ncbi:MAG TPA: hypothetical protein VGU02_00480 [Gaiellaceae bacterium]|nr:hypothetical protein [Gaiellaceae bacterium]